MGYKGWEDSDPESSSGESTPQVTAWVGTFSSRVHFMQASGVVFSLLEDILIKNAVRVSPFRELSERMQKVVLLVAARVLSKAGLSKLTEAIEGGKHRVEFELEDYRSKDKERLAQPKNRRTDGKKKLIMSCALKCLRKLFIKESEKEGLFKQSTDPTKHLLQTEINYKFFRKYLDPEGKVEIQTQRVNRAFKVIKREEDQYVKDGAHNQVFSLVHRGGMTREWISLIIRCPGWRTFIERLVDIVKGDAILKEYSVKIRSMVRGLQRLPSGPHGHHADANSEDEMLAIIEGKLLHQSGSEGKAPLSLLELAEHRSSVLDKLNRILQSKQESPN